MDALYSWWENLRECRRTFNAVNFARKDRRTLPQVVVGLPAKRDPRDLSSFFSFSSPFNFLFSFTIVPSFTHHFPVPSFPFRSFFLHLSFSYFLTSFSFSLPLSFSLSLSLTLNYHHARTLFPKATSVFYIFFPPLFFSWIITLPSYTSPPFTRNNSALIREKERESTLPARNFPSQWLQF